MKSFAYFIANEIGPGSFCFFNAYEFALLLAPRF